MPAEGLPQGQRLQTATQTGGARGARAKPPCASGEGLSTGPRSSPAGCCPGHARLRLGSARLRFSPFLQRGSAERLNAGLSGTARLPSCQPARRPRREQSGAWGCWGVSSGRGSWGCRKVGHSLRPAGGRAGRAAAAAASPPPRCRQPRQRWRGGGLRTNFDSCYNRCQSFLGFWLRLGTSCDVLENRT